MEPDVVEPGAADPDAVDSDAAEPDAVDSDAAGPDAVAATRRSVGPGATPQESASPEPEPATHEPGPPTAAPDGAWSDPDAGWLTTVTHLAFFLLLGGSLVRFLSRPEDGARTWWVVALFGVFGVLYLLGHPLGRFPSSAARPGAQPDARPGARPLARHPAWLGATLVVWAALLAVAPSATWCAMPLLFAGLHTLPVRAAIPLAAGLTALVVVSELRLAHGTFNPNLVVAPVAVGAVATAVLVHLQRQAARQRTLIEDLVRTRRDLAATERRAGVLAERQRLSTEIHDTLAQGLTSQQMLLQAADRLWSTAPDTARGHVREAAEIAARGLAEARRFVHDLAPADLADSGLAQALGTLAERESGAGLPTDFRLDGAPGPLPERVAAALLRIAQGALANAREHAGATRAAITLTCLDDQISLDVADNGRGFDPDRLPHPGSGPGPGTGTGGSGGRRGHGLPAMRVRARQLGGVLTVESAPGEGTVVSAAVPLAPSSVPDPAPEAAL